MYITVSTVEQKANEAEKIEKFLAQFFPRLEKHPGVISVYRYLRPEQEDSSTIIIWENQEAWNGYVGSSLKGEIDTFMRDNHLKIKREGFPLAYATRIEKFA
jgi:heme-degrading monooxygenase HmoA